MDIEDTQEYPDPQRGFADEGIFLYSLNVGYLTIRRRQQDVFV
jgi:hypothetical protein